MSSVLKFCVAQMDIVSNNPQENIHNLNREFLHHQEKIKNHVVILPEMFLTGFMPDQQIVETPDGQHIQGLKKIAADYFIILVGSIAMHENNKIYNRLCWFFPNGATHFYDKKHLFAMANEDAFFTNGTQRLITSISSWKIFSAICYDIRFPVWCRQSKPSEYDILICVANWPKKRIAHWKKLLVARAIENQCFVVATNRIGKDDNNVQYNGNSLIINPMGDIVLDCKSTAGLYFTTLYFQEIVDTRINFPFANDADNFVILN